MRGPGSKAWLARWTPRSRPRAAVCGKAGTRYSPASAAISRAPERLFVSPSSWARPSIISRGTATGIELAVARDAGMFLTTPGEAGARADTLFILAPEASEEARLFLERLLETTPKLAASDAPRNVIWVGKAPAPRARSRRLEITPVPVASARIAPLLAALRARLAGRPVGPAPLPGPSSRSDRRDPSPGEIRCRDLVIRCSRPARRRDACRAGARSQ